MVTDSCFEILLPEFVQIEGLECKQKTFSWDGVKYPQGSPIFQWGEYVEIAPTPIPRHLEMHLPANYIDERWICLSIRGKGLELLAQEVNGVLINWNGKSLIQIIELLISKSNKWVFVFELFCDQIDSSYILNVNEVLLRFQENLKYSNNPEGFIAIPPL